MDAEFRDTLRPRSLSGGQKSGQCADHPRRKSVWIMRDGRWLDTGICATDLRGLERAFRNTRKAKTRKTRTVEVRTMRAPEGDIWYVANGVGYRSITALRTEYPRPIRLVRINATPANRIFG